MGNDKQVLRVPIDLFHLLTWPQLSFVAQDHKGRIVGYILAKMCVLSILWEDHAH
jgi:N-alpha-acetyltransferase 10/11